VAKIASQSTTANEPSKETVSSTAFRNVSRKSTIREPSGRKFHRQPEMPQTADEQIHRLESKSQYAVFDVIESMILINPAIADLA